MESLWFDGLFIKIYNKTLNVQVNKEDRFSFFSYEIYFLDTLSGV
jgi:hypothetical protein